MMMQPAMVNPYASAAKTAEIMSRYRPIAPKPVDGGGGGAALAGVQSGGDGSCVGGYADGMSEKIQQSPYLRNLWPKLQARPTRTRKRGRMIGVSVSPAAFKRTSPPQPSAAAFLGLPPQPPQYYGWLGRGFVAASTVEKTVSPPSKAAAMGVVKTPVTLPLLPTSPASAERLNVEKGTVDLKSMAEMTAGEEEEKDLTLQLRGPESSVSSSASNSVNNVISPRPMRPVGSCITITSLTPKVNASDTNHHPKTVTKEAIEAEIESDEVPAIVTDSRNRVRLTNSAYNEMVGQPKCMWLGARIAGEVLVKFNTTTTTTQLSSVHGEGGFKGWVKIEWGPSASNKRTCDKTAIDASCNVHRLPCVSNDYVFAWRFRAV